MLLEAASPVVDDLMIERIFGAVLLNTTDKTGETLASWSPRPPLAACSQLRCSLEQPGEFACSALL